MLFRLNYILGSGVKRCSSTISAKHVSANVSGSLPSLQGSKIIRKKYSKSFIKIRKSQILESDSSLKRFQLQILEYRIKGPEDASKISGQLMAEISMKSTKIKPTERDPRNRLTMMSNYLEACIISGNMELAIKALNVAKHFFKKLHPHILNSVLKKAAIDGKPEFFHRTWNLAGPCSLFSDSRDDFTGAWVSLGIVAGRFPNLNWAEELEFPPIPPDPKLILNDSYFLNPNERAYLLRGLESLNVVLPLYSDGPKDRYSKRILKEISEADDSGLSSQLDTETTKEILIKNYSRQLETEMKGYEIIDSVMSKKGVSSGLKLVNQARESLIAEWTEKITASLKVRFEALKKKEKKTYNLSGLGLYPFFAALPIEEYAKIAVDEAVRLLSSSESYCPSAYVIQYSLGQKVFKNIQTKSFSTPEYLEIFNRSYSRYLDWYLFPKGDFNHREAILNVFLKKENKHLEIPMTKWTKTLETSVGKELLKQIMDNILVDLDSKGNVVVNGKVIKIMEVKGITFSPATTNSKSPGLYKIYRQRKYSQVEEIKPHPSLSKIFSYAKLHSLKFSTNELPMIVPPLPWSSPRRGGYLLSTSDFIRIIDDEGSVEQDDYCDFRPILDSVNQLGSTPWIVNKKILELAIYLFQSSDPQHKELQSELSIPVHPDFLPIPELESSVAQKMSNGETLDDKDLASIKKFNLNKRVYSRIKGESYSLWCDSLYRLSLANHFIDDVLFFPHNIDFRGRVYPIPPHFNHMGGDLSRSLLIFAKGAPLGPNGLSWLKLQVINLTGLKKRCSIKERLQYAEEILDDILDSAERPLEGRRWWVKSEEPWQTLAVCTEIKAALDSKDPENYISRIPIHQDGSCNGLQHYAAIGRDVLGASSVNLIPSDIPQDVYSEIAALVEKRREIDATKEKKPIALSLEGVINRKVIKQTVMTTVYGVTRYGARLQIARQLKDIDSFPHDLVDEAATYLAARTFESLNELFTASQEIQIWLTEAANVISRIYQSNVEWETPLGLKVVQPYTKMIGANPHRMALWCYPRLSKIQINHVKQRNGFPPNFIHSLDSSHMMLTSLHLWAKGITFASVHDCYWTHPKDVEIMNAVTRRQFINLHSEPILEDLSAAFENKFDVSVNKRVDSIKAKMLFKAVPSKGNLDLSVVNDSIYFFS